MKPKSDSIFHFTSSLDVLKLILSNGIQPRYCLEDVEWFGLNKIKHLAFPMSCFCDIPLSRISEHTGFYGEYGIGLSKDWALKNGLNPVIYSPTNGKIQELVKYFFYSNIYEHDGEHDLRYEFNIQLYKAWALVKPLSGKMVISNKIISKDFYQENEWRFVPPVDQMIYEADFETDKVKANKDIEQYALEFTPSDIRYLFVPSDNNIPELSDFIHKNLGQYPLNDLKILQSRIVSLETLNRDI